jgi:hypothetical protein
MATSFSGGRSQSTLREPPTMGKQLVNFITCGGESSAPLFVIYKAGREPTSYLVIGLYELLGNPTNPLSHPGSSIIKIIGVHWIKIMKRMHNIKH